MPTFDTPEPISVTISLIVGDARLTASERSDTVVAVSPTDSSRDADVKAARQTRVEYSDGALRLKAPRPWKQYSPFGNGGSIDVSIQLPAGSQVHSDTTMADFHSEGRLGECRITTQAGDIRLDHTGPLHLSTGLGNVTVDRAVGPTEATGAGELRIREIDGTAVLKNLNGATWVGEVTGDLRCSAANGDITVDRAHGAVRAKSANGSVEVGDVARGPVVLDTASGGLEVGIREGTAALLDMRSQFGSVRNSLDASTGPQPSDETVEVRARTSYGDIVIRRSHEESP